MNQALRAIFWLSIIVFGFTGCNEGWTKHFQNVEDARKEGLIDKGWIPAFIPLDATSLVISGDQDSGIALGSFVSTDSKSIRKVCAGASDSLSIPDYAARWLGLASASDAAALRKKGYDVFECSVQNFNVAYLDSKHEFYYWTPRKQ